jgi:hypothetical protein
MVNANPALPPPTIRITETFDLDGATGLAGSGPLLDYVLGTMSLAKRYAERLPELKAANATYSGAFDLAFLVTGRILGFIRPEDYGSITGEPFLSRRFGVERLPDPTTIHRTLHRLEGEDKRAACRDVHRSVLADALRLDGFEPYTILDADSSVEIVYGEQMEGGVVGYNPNAHGRRSYRPLLFTDGVRQLVLGAWLRPGDSAEYSDLFDRLKETCFEMEALGRPVLFFRADRGFQGEEVFAFCEGRNIGYAIKIRETSGLGKALAEATFVPVSGPDEAEEIEVADLHVRLHGWSRVRRVVAVRRRFEDPARPYLPRLGWRYEFVATNIEGDAWAVADFYNKRCRAENVIKELKFGYGIDRLSTASFGANDADLVLKITAYNLVWAFRNQVLPAHWRPMTIRRLRLALLHVPGVLVHHARRLTLRIASWYPHQEEFQAIRERLAPLLT